MTLFRTLVAVAALPLATAATARTPAKIVRSCPVTSVAAIEAQFGRFNAAWATGNPDTVTALFTANPVLLPTLSNVPRTTPAAVRDYFVGFLKNRPSARIETSTIKTDCQTASRTGTWTVTLTDPATDVARDVKARYSFIYRFENGGWKIDHLHSSVDPAPKA